MEITREGLVATLAGVGVFGALIIIVASGQRGEVTPTPTASVTSGLRTATQGPRSTYPDCRDAQPPCVSRVAGEAWLITESGARIPVTVVDTDERSTPRTVTVA